MIDPQPAMSRITRYILCELLAMFFVAVTAMTVLMLVVGLAQEALRQGLGPLAIVRLVPYVVPNALLFAVPGTMLFAACSVYGRMSAANEVVAVKSLGVPPMVIIWPALVLAFLLSLVTVWLNDVAVSWGREGINRVVIQSVEEVTYGMLRTQRSYSTSRFSINVKRVDGRRLINPTVVVYSGGDQSPMTLMAEEAELRSDFKNDMLVVTLWRGTLDMGHATLVFKDEFVHKMPLSDASRKGRALDSPSNYSLREIPEQQQIEWEEIQQMEKALALDAAMQMATGDFAGLTSEDWNARRQEIVTARGRLYRLKTEPWRRWANGFSCFFFVLVGTPLAIRMRTSDLWTTFALCFLPILVVYYPLMAYGVDRAKCGALPPPAVWIGNLILLVIGVWLLRKVNRY